MKEVKYYICEVCGTEYNDKKKCTDCEKRHKKPMKIVSARYVSISNNYLGIPSKIEVEMDDGSKFEYKR